jgi:hypothetical protein
MTSSHWLVWGGGGSIKASPLPHLEGTGSTNENTHPKAFETSPQHLFVRFQ